MSNSIDRASVVGAVAAVPSAAAWHVLVVDDNPDDRAEARRLLLKGSERRYRFTEAGNGADAVRVVKNEPTAGPRCLVIDYNLPDMDALEVVSSLIGPHQLPLCPVVVLTGSVGEDIGRAVLRAGAQDYIGKDWLTAQALTRAIENAVERWHMARELQARADRDAYRLALADALRPLDEPEAVLRAAAAVLGRQLQPDRVVYVDVEPSGALELHTGYRTHVVAIDGHHHLDDYGRTLRRELSAGRNIVTTDVRADAAYTDEEKVRYAAVEIVANLSVPLHKDGRLVAIVGVHQNTPREWSAADIELAEETAQTTWTAVQRAQAEAALRISEERLGLALRATAAIGFTWDVQTDSAIRFHSTVPSLPPNRDVPQRVAEVAAAVHPDDRAAFEASVRGCLQSGHEYRAEYRTLNPDGSERWLVEEGVLQRDADGTPLRLTGVSRDVTDQKRALDAVRASEQFRRKVFDQLVTFAGVLSLDGTMIEVNQAPLAAAGLSRDDVIGKPFYECAWWCYSAQVQTRLCDAIARAASGETVRYDEQVMMSNGLSLVDVQIAPLRDESGRVTHLIPSGIDISERVQAERALQASEERLRLALEASSTGLWTWDLQTDAVKWSPECYAILDVPLEGFAGTTAAFFALVHDEDRDRVDSSVRAAIASRALYDCEFRIIRPSGAVVWVSNRGRARYDEAGRPLQMLGTITDIDDRKRAEIELARSEAFARSVVEASADCIKGLTPDGRLLWMNENGKRLMEVCNFELLRGCDWASFWEPGGIRPEAEAALSSARAGGVGRFCGFCPTAAGTGRWWDVAVTPIVGPDGEIEQLLSVSRDVTESRKQGEALRKAQTLTQALIDGSTALVFAKDLDGRYFLSNRAWQNFVGLSWEQAIGKTDETLFGPDVAQMLRDNDRLALDAVEPMMFEEAAEVRGRSVVYLSSKFALRGEDGKVYAVCGVSTDITALKTAEVALQAQKRELQTLADNTPDLMTRFDRALRHVFVNAAVERATGLTMEQCIGRTHRDLGLPADLCEQWDAALHEVFQTGQPRSLEFSFSDAGGARHYAAQLVPEYGSEGRVEFVLGVSHDMTERKRFENTLAEQDKRKDEFIATLAHELRGPLAPLRNGLSLLERHRSLPADGPLTRTVEMMGRQLRHLVVLVDDLLDVSRVSQGKITLKRELVTLKEVIGAAIEACEPLVQVRRHTLTVVLASDSMTVEGDRDRLVQVLVNLITNAAKYSEPGGRITITARENDGLAIIAVTDTGVGISRELLPTLWDMFTQVRDTLDKAQGGLGIGLSLVKKLVGLHGGSVMAESDGPGCGSTFTISLPVASLRQNAETNRVTP